MYRTDNNMHVFAGVTPGGAVADNVALTDYTLLEEGEVVIANADNNDVELGSITANTDQNLQVIQRIGTKLKKSSIFNFKDIIDVRVINDAAEAQQKTHIGYIGSGSNSITATSDNDYKLTLGFKHDSALFAEQSDTRVYHYTSDASATQVEIADAFAKRIALDGGVDVSCKRLCDNAGAALGTGVNNLTFTKGGTYVSCSGDVDDTTGGGTALAAGTYIRVNSTATTGEMYKIASIDTTNDSLELDAPFQSTTVTVADTVMEQVSAANAASANWGLELEGEAYTYSVGLTPFNVVAWDTNLSGWGSTSVTATTAASSGVGVGEMVKDLEWFALGAGIVRGPGHPTSTALGELKAVEASNYNVISIEYYTSPEQAHPVSGVARQKSVIYIFEVDVTQTNALGAVFDNAPGDTTDVA